MKTSEAGLSLIKKWESFQPRPYLCPANYWTIGYGHLIKDYPENNRFPPGSVLTEPEAEELLAEDVEIAERAVLRLIKAPLTQGQFDALVSFTFNLGAGKLQASTLRQKVNRREYLSAADEFGKWVWAGGKKMRGLISRRRDEALLFLS